MAKLGFGGQWIEIFRIGNHTDNAGHNRTFNHDFMNQVVANFSGATHEPPVVVGHPKDNAPAFGWVKGLRVNGETLEAQFGETDDEFEDLVKAGRFKKRSAAFYLTPPTLRHVGFLGAQPPALKGLREINFHDGGESVTVETSFSEEIMAEDTNKIEEENKTRFAEWMQKLFGGNAPMPSVIPAVTSFSEADKSALIAEAVKQATEAATVNFTEQLKIKDADILALKNSINSFSTSGKRAEFVAFAESIPVESGKHFLNRVGIVEFMEALDAADAKDASPAITMFSEADGKREEVKFSRLEWFKDYVSALPRFISFGESFGKLVVTEKGEVVDKVAADEMRREMGLKTGGDK